MRAPLALAILLSTTLALADEPNAADRETARIAFTEGNKLRDEGNVRGALEKYKAAYALAPTPVTALEVGRAESDLGQLVEAREVLLRVDSMPARNESAKAQAARAEAAQIAARLVQRIPKITLRVVGAAETATITVDGATIPKEALSVARTLNPGRHVALAMIAGHSVQQIVELREGETRDVVLDLSAFARATQLPVQTQVVPQNASQASGIVAFNTPEDGHAWTLRDPSGARVCRLPCTQSLGFASGYKLVRDDGETVGVPPGLAALPGSGAQLVPSGSAGNPTLGWILFTTGTAAAIGSIFIPVATASDTNQGPPVAAFLTLLLGGTTALTVGLFVLMLSHGPMLMRTDMGMPMRIAKKKQSPTFHVGPTGVFGTF